MSYYKIPNNYRKNNKEMTPAYLRNFDHFQYVNLDETVSDIDFDDWILSIFDSLGNEVDSDIGTITKDVISGSDYRFYFSFNIDLSVDPGIYYMVVYNSSTNDVKYVSNCIEVITEDDIECYVYLEYRNSSDIFNYNYEDVVNYNTVFLEMNLIEAEPEIQLTTYREQTTGYRRNRKSQTSQVISMETQFFDDGANDMMFALSVHDDIKINGTVVEVKTAYKIDTNKFNSVQKGVIEFYNQEYSTVNLHG